MAGSEKFSHVMTPAMQQAADNGAMGYGLEIRETHAGFKTEVYKNIEEMKRHEATESDYEKLMEMD